MVQDGLKMDTQERIMFELDKEQVKELIEWKKTHKCSDEYTVAVGGQYDYIFSPTGLGMHCEIYCNACGSSINLTDSDNW